MSLASLLSSRLIALPLRNANFGLYSAGSAVSLIGMWMQRIAIGWLTWEMTKSGLWLGIIAFADFFPSADRTDRGRRGRPLGPPARGEDQPDHFLGSGHRPLALTATDHMNIGLLVALTAFQGVVVAFNQPARLALVPSLVAQTDLASAVAINSVVFNLARFIGPMLAGLAIVWSGVVRGLRGQCRELPRLPGGAGAHPRDANRGRARQATQLYRRSTRRHPLYGEHPGIAALLCY